MRKDPLGLGIHVGLSQCPCHSVVVPVDSVRWFLFALSETVAVFSLVVSVGMNAREWFSWENFWSLLQFGSAEWVACLPPLSYPPLGPVGQLFTHVSYFVLTDFSMALPDRDKFCFIDYFGDLLSWENIFCFYFVYSHNYQILWGFGFFCLFWVGVGGATGDTGASARTFTLDCIPSPFLNFFWNRVLLSCSGWAPTVILLRQSPRVLELEVCVQLTLCIFDKKFRP